MKTKKRLSRDLKQIHSTLQASTQKSSSIEVQFSRKVVMRLSKFTIKALRSHSSAFCDRKISTNVIIMHGQSELTQYSRISRYTGVVI